MRIHIIRAAGIITGWLMIANMIAGAEPGPSVLDRIFVDEVWAGHRVGFCLLTEAPYQYVAYYNTDRDMVVARRHLDSSEWERTILPERVGWDSHNYITMAMDSNRCLHVSGNMHCVPLVYFRCDEPLAISGLRRIPTMVGEREGRCTYPVFLRGPTDELVFMYRDGGSGNGDQIFNQYSTTTRSWRRLLDEPLTTGHGQMNAYLHGPVRGDDGFYHLCWVWRDTPDCSTNHDLCYARSRDLVNWEDSSGRPLELPISLETAEIVDPVPAGGGMINGNTIIGFDHDGRVVITYHKYDHEGNTQVYAARREESGWVSYQISDWADRWDFSGGGTIPFLVHVQGVKPVDDGKLEMGYGHWLKGSGVWILDDATMTRIGEREPDKRYPRLEKRPEERGLQDNWAADSGETGDKRYALHWATLGVNRDRPQDLGGDGAVLTSRLEVILLGGGVGGR